MSLRDSQTCTRISGVDGENRLCFKNQLVQGGDLCLYAIKHLPTLSKTASRELISYLLDSDRTSDHVCAFLYSKQVMLSTSFALEISEVFTQYLL